jgi:hypothetical protein
MLCLSMEPATVLDHARYAKPFRQPIEMIKVSFGSSPNKNQTAVATCLAEERESFVNFVYAL